MSQETKRAPERLVFGQRGELPAAAPLLSFGASLTATGTTIEGPLVTTDRSLLTLNSVTHSLPAAFADSNRVGSDSTLQVFGSSVLDQDVFLQGFSNAIMGGDLTILGSLICDASSDAHCTGSLTATSSSCGLCPLP